LSGPADDAIQVFGYGTPLASMSGRRGTRVRIELEDPDVSLHHREQIDWASRRRRTSSSAYAQALFALIEGLGITNAGRLG
jgi:hypothetical protein